MTRLIFRYSFRGQVHGKSGSNVRQSNQQLMNQYRDRIGTLLGITNLIYDQKYITSVKVYISIKRYNPAEETCSGKWKTS